MAFISTYGQNNKMSLDFSCGGVFKVSKIFDSNMFACLFQKVNLLLLSPHFLTTICLYIVDIEIDAIETQRILHYKDFSYALQY